MKGMMFSEFTEWVERSWSMDTADEVIDDTHLPSGGAYTAVGTYDHQEMVALVVTLSKKVNRPVPDLVREFGHNLFSRLAQSHPEALKDADTAFALLGRLEDHIHPEVRKLYPGAEVPSFASSGDARSLSLTYRSPRGLADLAHGLIEGCAEWFGEDLTVEREQLHDGTTRFHIERRDVE